MLYLCGTQDAIPEEELDGRHHLVLKVPHTGGIAITETPQIPYLEMLGVRRQVIAYIGDPQWISSPCMNRMIADEESTLQTVFNAGDPFNLTTNAALREQFIQENPDAIIIGGPFGDAEGDRTIIAAATQERTTVATFDWIGYYAAFFNMEGEANKITAKAKSRFDCASSNSALLSADTAADERPKVLWATYFTGYNWSVAECPTWSSTFYCEYAHHCAADIISRPEGLGYEDTTFGSFWYLDDEQLLEIGKDADYFVYPSSTWDTVYAEKKDVLDQIKAVQNKQVFDSQGRGPFAWHEQRLAEYDVVALDFCEMVGTTGVPHELQWLRNIYTDPVGSLPTCSFDYQIDEPHVAQGATCKRLVASGAVSVLRWSGAMTLLVLAASSMV